VRLAELPRAGVLVGILDVEELFENSRVAMRDSMLWSSLSASTSFHQDFHFTEDWEDNSSNPFAAANKCTGFSEIAALLKNGDEVSA
jgi:hypothetical protein